MFELGFKMQVLQYKIKGSNILEWEVDYNSTLGTKEQKDHRA